MFGSLCHSGDWRLEIGDWGLKNSLQSPIPSLPFDNNHSIFSSMEYSKLLSCHTHDILSRKELTPNSDNQVAWQQVQAMQKYEPSKEGEIHAKHLLWA